MIRVALFINIIQRTLSVFLSFLGFVSVTAFESHLGELNTLRAIVLFAEYTYIRDIWSRKRLTVTVIIWIYHLPFIDWHFGVFPAAKIFKAQWILISGEFWTACLLQLDWLFMRLGQSVKIYGTFLIGVIWTAQSFGEIVMSVSQTATEYEALSSS